jgi:two-component system, NarL family, response regulator NreC
MSSERITIVVADDHPIVRSGLRTLLEGEDDIEVLAEAADVEEAVRKVRGHKPRVLVLDLKMPGPVGTDSAIDAIPQIREANEGTQVIILTMHAEPAYARAAVRAGASGYALKEAAQTELVEAVRQVAAGSTYMHPELGMRLAREPEDEGPPDGLSEREAEILGLVALGHTNQEIAERLYLSPRTIEAHRGHIQQKLRFETRADLVRYAFEHGLTEIGVG